MEDRLTRDRTQKTRENHLPSPSLAPCSNVKPIQSFPLVRLCSVHLTQLILSIRLQNTLFVTGSYFVVNEGFDINSDELIVEFIDKKKVEG